MKIERADRFRIDRSFKEVAATSLPSAEIKCGFRIEVLALVAFFQTH